MDKCAFEAAKVAFEYVKVDKAYKDLYAKRRKFVEYFTLEKILSMDLDDYVEGKGINDLKNFCYAVEWGFEKLGKIQGATSIKFGIYYSKKKNKYIYARKYGKNYKDAFAMIKQEIVNLIKAGATKNMEAIRCNTLSPMFKGKILYLYYPDKYLNIFAESHIDYYITELGCDKIGCSQMDVVDKRELLLDFKNRDENMKKWNINMFSRFLYTVYPKSPNNKGQHEEKFDLLESVEFEEHDYHVNKKGRILLKSSVGKIDYEAQQRRAKRLGNRGERIVLEAEKEWLRQHGVEKKPIYVANTDDSKGYDIQSWFADGSSKYIEVKATKSFMGNNSFFYLLTNI